ncbi:MAG: biotin transporter BioY [Oscillospiraceae bacterium]|nr:biotin transporter BioY [Oscillospiraceae bacterium]
MSNKSAHMTKIITYTAISTALMASGAFIKIPFFPVPLTLQSLFCVISGATLGYKYGPLSQFIYIILGLAGLPVFTSGGGIAYVFSPTFGYILGFVLSSFVVGFILKYRRVKSIAGYFAVCFAGLLCVYIIGVPYLFAVLNIANKYGKGFAYFLTAGFLDFIPGDILKAAAAASVLKLAGKQFGL